MPQSAHLIYGLLGADKTTYAEQLCIDLNGVRFSTGDWNRRLFFMDGDPTSDFNWFYERMQLRNTEQGETFRLEVTRDMFDFMHTIWEAPESDELAQRNGHHITN